MKHTLITLIVTFVLTASLSSFADGSTGPATIGPDGTTSAEMLQRQGGAEFAPDAVAPGETN